MMKSDNSRTAVFAGSFDPVTNGHIDIVKRAAKLFDKVVIGLGISADKRSIFSQQERLELLQNVFSGMPQIQISSFSGLTVEFAKSIGASALVRGLRTEADFAYESSFAQMNWHLAKDIETVFIISDPRFFHISSTLVKEVAMFGGDVSSLVPPIVAKKIAEKFK